MNDSLTPDSLKIRCPECNALLVLVGRVHRCAPKPNQFEDAARGRDMPKAKRGRPRLGEDKPWVAAGVSKATWYRRRKDTGQT